MGCWELHFQLFKHVHWKAPVYLKEDILWWDLLSVSRSLLFDILRQLVCELMWEEEEEEEGKTGHLMWITWEAHIAASVLTED